MGLLRTTIARRTADANANGVEAIEALLAARTLLRPAKIATGRVVPLAGVLGLFHFGVVPEVEPFQLPTRITRLDMGWVAIVLSCDVVGNVRDLSAEGVVEGIIGCPHQPKVSWSLVTLRAVEACQRPVNLWLGRVVLARPRAPCDPTRNDISPDRSGLWIYCSQNIAMRTLDHENKGFTPMNATHQAKPPTPVKRTVSRGRLPNAHYRQP
jgi:hypothetical protein